MFTPDMNGSAIAFDAINTMLNMQGEALPKKTIYYRTIFYLNSQYNCPSISASHTIAIIYLFRQANVTWGNTAESQRATRTATTRFLALHR